MKKQYDDTTINKRLFHLKVLVLGIFTFIFTSFFTNIYFFPSEAAVIAVCVSGTVLIMHKLNELLEEIKKRDN